MNTLPNTAIWLALQGLFSSLAWAASHAFSFVTTQLLWGPKEVPSFLSSGSPHMLFLSQPDLAQPNLTYISDSNFNISP